MKKRVLVLAAAALMAVSCTVSYPGMATKNRIEKEGKQERTVWFGIAIKPIDLSIATAAKNGGITKVATVDYAVKTGLFKSTYKIVVTGN